MGTHQYGGALQSPVSAYLTTESGTTAGYADYTTSTVGVNAVATTDRHQVILQATIEDYLDFTVPSGTVGLNIHIGGNWRVGNVENSDTPQVEFIFNWSKVGDPWWSSLTYDSGTYAGGYTYGPGTFNADGTYSFNVPTLTITSGQYALGMTVKAYAGNGDTAYIDDPIVIDLPDGVTFVSASGSRYSGTAPVPLPAAAFLLAPGLLGLAIMKKREKP
jgi:hypothetical protein